MNPAGGLETGAPSKTSVCSLEPCERDVSVLLDPSIHMQAGAYSELPIPILEWYLWD